MTKPLPMVPKTETKPARADAKAAEGEKTSLAYTIRETIESIVIAFVLAFLFRTFEAEAFVIPTGSMAPTLQGRHKDVECPQCHYAYRVSASNEVNDVTGEAITNAAVAQVTCPMCRFPRDIERREDPSYNGDRILVGKFPYDFADPKRWDVVVFKYPGDAKMNYIKRLVGLPGEKLAIYQGDLFLRDDKRNELEILRKPPDKIQSMAQMVYDNDYVVDEMTEKGWPLRWQPWNLQGGDRGWKSSDGGRSYTIETAGADAQWIRYQHFPPTKSDWNALTRGEALQKVPPQLITDFYAYNTNLNFDQRQHKEDLPNLAGLHWAGDLMLKCDVEVAGDQGAVILDLVRGGEHFLCTIDVATGEAKLTMANDAKRPGKTPVGATKLKGPGSYSIAFANFDHQLVLWVGGKLVQFDQPTDYDLLVDTPHASPQDAGDLAPAGVAAQGVGMTVKHLKVLRDIYYIAQGSRYAAMNDYPDDFQLRNTDRERLTQILSDPSQWAMFNPDNMRMVPINLEADQFFVLGDNSPFSKDARLWEAERYVKRELLIGKALYIYWPHSFDRVPGTKIPLPFFPNFGAMGFVR